MRKRLALIFIPLFFATACGTSAETVEENEAITEDEVGTFTKTLNDGQIVECLYFIGWKAGGAWCTPSLGE